MANEMPPSSDFTGLSRKVIAYSEGFSGVAAKAAAGMLSDADWAEMETLVDVDGFVREGVFVGAEAEVIDWATYRHYVTMYAGHTTWEGTLRRITEVPGLVFLELEERNTRGGMTHVSNTVTIYEFNDAGKLKRLHVYVSPIGERPAE